MCRIKIYTDDGTLIDTVRAEDTMIQDGEQIDQLQFQILDAMITAAKIQLLRYAAARDLLAQINKSTGGKIT